MPLVVAYAECQVSFIVFKMTVAFCAVARQVQSLSQGDDQPFFVQFAGFEIHAVDENVARISQVCDGGGEEIAWG